MEKTRTMTDSEYRKELGSIYTQYNELEREYSLFAGEVTLQAVRDERDRKIEELKTNRRS